MGHKLADDWRPSTIVTAKDRSRLLSENSRDVTTENRETHRAIMWLPTLVSTLFLAEAIWRFVDEGDTVEQRASAIFNGVNTIIFALLGFACVSWPLISAKFQGQKDGKNVESEETAKDEVVVVVERQDSLSVLKAARSGGRRDDDKKAEVSSAPPADAPASPAPADAPELPA